MAASAPVAASHDAQASQSLSRFQGSSTVRPVVTQPPWAKHEPPSPDIEALPISDLALHPLHSLHSSSAQRTSTSSLPSSSASAGPADARRWRLPSMLNQLRRNEKQSELPRTSEEDSPRDLQQPSESDASYFPTPPVRQQLSIQMPRNAHSFTLAQSKTPGWSTPWAPGRPSRAYLRSGTVRQADAFDEIPEHEKTDVEMSSWKRRKKSVRNFVLTNAYVPLIIRLLNFSLTSATLGIAIRLRHIEIQHDALGLVGSSPILAIIFAPLTLVHVLVAIYLEYFGRPLGLWRTSGKLAHTLLEVLFICIWSGTFSVAIENYFTSPLLCAPASLNKWWNHLPPQSPLLDYDFGRREGGVADVICDEQLVNVCLELVGLCLYCGSLVISLYRIFEKVKIHTTLNASYTYGY